MATDADPALTIPSLTLALQGWRDKFEKLRLDACGRGLRSIDIPVVLGLQRLVRSMDSMALLAQAGMFDDLACVGRSFIDVVVTASFLADGDDATRHARCRAWGLYAHVRKLKLVRRLKQSTDHWLRSLYTDAMAMREDGLLRDKQEWEAARPFKADDGHWTGSFTETVKALGLGGVYDSAYFDWSEYVHGSPGTLEDPLRVDHERGELTLGVRSDEKLGIRVLAICGSTAEAVLPHLRGALLPSAA